MITANGKFFGRLDKKKLEMEFEVKDLFVDDDDVRYLDGLDTQVADAKKTFRDWMASHRVRGRILLNDAFAVKPHALFGG